MANISRICRKRLLGDLKLLNKEPLEYITASPDENDMLTWYFMVKGPEFSDYDGGYYIGKIMHNPEYPFKPPDFMMLTPNGRFLTDRKICLSNSGYHSSEWSAMWNIKSILIGFLSIMLDDKENGISHIHISKEERRYYARNSIDFNKEKYRHLLPKFSRFIDENGNPHQKNEHSESIKKEDTHKEGTHKENNCVIEKMNLDENEIENLNIKIRETEKKYNKIIKDAK